jgi:hypothetical protein
VYGGSLVKIIHNSLSDLAPQRFGEVVRKFSFRQRSASEVDYRRTSSIERSGSSELELEV